VCWVGRGGRSSAISPLQARRMRQLVHCLELANGDVGVDPRGGNVGMPEDHLDEPDVRAVLQHVRGQRVPEGVATALPEAGQAHIALDQVRQAVLPERLAVVRQEQRHLVRQAPQQRSHLAHVARHPDGGTCPERYEPVLASFTQPHHQRAALGVDVVQRQAHQFGTPDARAVQRFQDRPVAQAHRRVGVGAVQQQTRLMTSVIGTSL